MDYVYIGGTPSDERCAAIGITENAQSLNRLECAAYIVALRRKYGEEPEGAHFRARREEHDFGSYYEVVCVFDGNDKAAAEYAYKTENGLAHWEEVGMKAPVTYDDAGQPVTIERDEAKWIVP
jgi:hypothetical protein